MPGIKKTSVDEGGEGEEEPAGSKESSDGEDVESSRTASEAEEDEDLSLSEGEAQVAEQSVEQALLAKQDSRREGGKDKDSYQAEEKKQEESSSSEEAEEKGAANPYRAIIQAIQTNLEVHKELEESEAADSDEDADKVSEARTATPKNMTGKEGADSFDVLGAGTPQESGQTKEENGDLHMMFPQAPINLDNNQTEGAAGVERGTVKKQPTPGEQQQEIIELSNDCNGQTFEASMNEIETRSSKNDEVLLQRYICEVPNIFSGELLSNQTFQISDTRQVKDAWVRKFNCRNRKFFYVLGTNLNQYEFSYVPIIVIYEYFLQKDTSLAPVLLTEIPLNNKHLPTNCVNTDFVALNGQYLYYLKIDNDVEAREIHMKVCRFGVITQQEEEVCSWTDIMGFDEKEKVHVLAACGVFASNRAEEKDTDDQVSDQHQYIKSKFIMIKYSQRNSFEYAIRRIGDFKRDLVHGHEHVHADYRALSNQTQVSLIVIRKSELYQFGVNEDIIALQVKDDSTQTKALGPVWRFSRIWEISSKQATLALRDITSHVLDLPVLKQQLDRQLLSPFFIHSSLLNKPGGSSSEVEQRVTSKSQYRFFEEVVSVLGRTAPPNPNNLSVNIDHDSMNGLYTIIATIQDKLVFQQIKDREFRQFDIFKVERLHPLSRAAYEIGFGKEQKQGGQTSFLQRERESFGKEPWQVRQLDDESHKFTATADQSQIAEQQMQNYHIYDLLNDKAAFDVKRFDYVAFRDRPFTLRINASTDRSQFFEMYDYQRKKSILKIPLVATFKRSEYLLQNFCESSSIYQKSTRSGWRYQNFQFISIKGSLIYAEILEYEVGWALEALKPITMILIGIKRLFLKQVCPEVANNKFYPLFDDCSQIIGTQILPSYVRDLGKESSEVDETNPEQIQNSTLYLKFENFSTRDFQFNTDVTRAGYKTYHNLQEQGNDILLLEVCLSGSIRDAVSTFTSNERHTLLENSMRTLMSTVPINIQHFLRDPASFDYLQPSGILNGQTYADYHLKFPKQLHKLLETMDKDEPMQPSLIDNYLQNDALKKDLEDKGELRHKFEIVGDFHNSNSLERCFSFKSHQRASAHMLLKHLLTFPTTLFRQRIMMSVLNHFIYSRESFECLSAFFKDFEQGSEGRQEQSSLCFSYHQVDITLPLNSDKLRETRHFSAEQKPLLSSYLDEVHKSIIENGEKKAAATKSISVEHFLFDFTPHILNQKLRNFGSHLEYEAHMTEFELSDLVYHIVSKYKLEVNEFTSLMQLIDSQYEKTVIIFRAQFWFYLFLYFIPFLLQLFMFQDNFLGLLVCNGLCLFSSFVFFVNELIQLRSGGGEQYLQGFFNWFEISMFPMCLAYFIMRLHFQGSLLPKDFDNTSGRLTLTSLSMLSLFNSVMLLWAVIKTLFFLRVNEEFSLLIQMVKQCFIDVSAFTAFFVFWIIMFCCWFMILGVEINVNDYHLMHEFPMFFIQSFRNTQGDISPPVYDFWRSISRSGELDQNISYAMIAIIWLFWIINEFIMAVVFMNFVLAIITQSYDDVMSKAELNKYVKRSDLNREARLFLKSCIRLTKFDALILSANCQFDSVDGAERETWQGFVQTIKTHIAAQNVMIKAKVHAQARDISTNIGDQEKKMTDAIKTELAQINSQIDYALSGVNSIHQWVQSQSQIESGMKDEAPGRVQDMDKKQNLVASNHEEVAEQKAQQEKEEERDREMLEVEERLKALQRTQMVDLKTELQPMLEEVQRELKSYIAVFKKELPPPAKKPGPLPPNTVAPQMPDVQRAKEKLEALSQVQELHEKAQADNAQTHTKHKEEVQEYLAELNGKMQILKLKQETTQDEVEEDIEHFKSVVDRISTLLKQLVSQN